MPGNHEDHLSSEEMSKVVSLRKKREEACIFCGQKENLEPFKGKLVCSRCRHTIPIIFSYVSNVK